MISLFGKNPNTLGLIHFIGIGGAGMSALAEMLHAYGYRVQGSDVSDNSNVRRLKKQGIHVYYGHGASYVEKAFRVVISSAIKDDNPELAAAKKLGVRVMHRSELLAEILNHHKAVSVAGTHGKTTTTGLIYTVLEHAKYTPGVVNGGMIYSIRSHAKIAGHVGDYMVAEADESDGSFTALGGHTVVITNVDPEHLDYYGDVERMYQAFDVFMNSASDQGAIVLGVDHPYVRKMVQMVTSQARVVTYGLAPDADVRAKNVAQTGASMTFDIAYQNKQYTGFRINMPGVHNVKNALAAIAVGLSAGADMDTMKAGLLAFMGVGRRFIKLGHVNGAIVIDDYAHHPVEIKSTLAGARSGFKGKLVAVFQPHRYSRLHDLFDDFASSFDLADEIVLAPVYAAGETAIEGVTTAELAKKISKRYPQKKVHMVANREDFAHTLPTIVNEGDSVISMGAGDINQWAAYAVKKNLS